MFTLDNLPSHGTLYLFATADATEWAEDDYRQASGWVSGDNPRDLFDSRNDVAPLLSIDLPLTEDDKDEILDTLADFLGYVDSADRGTFYGGHEDIDYATCVTYTYAAHLSVKHDPGNGYRESDVSIDADIINAH